MPMASVTPQEVIREVGLESEWSRLRQRVMHWVGHSDPDLRPMLKQQFEGSSKYFRPLTVFACHRAVSSEPVSERVLIAAQAVEMFHNVTLIVDDLVDGSPTRRDKLTLHAKYGPLTAWMVAGYIDACANDLLASRMPDESADLRGDDDETRARRRDGLFDGSDGRAAKDRASASVLAPRRFDTRRDWEPINLAGPVRFDLRLLSELKKRLAIAECVQWHNRKGGVLRPGKKRSMRMLGLADWRYLAREDTGSMFEICACLGARSQRYRRFGRLLGMLYHGCDDVADVRALKRLGGGGEEDLEEGILTLPAALAIQHSERIRALHAKPKRTPRELKTLRAALVEQLPQAAQELDAIRRQVEVEAQRLGVRNAAQMHRLIDHVRQLAPADDGERAA
ncbi:polyprenyl synthetase family protein [Aquincola sp. S2]|uniref:Polyprenyl synthetase family protein n=1 Tax=Pseudaquabacterium terrae TaxID=2732868 RepID=A0ABX2EPH9_9BURK|nr:polyprenyl synthetase family protein [Aquabacterium terrae]NRF70607.1 polyprenyl synthetase family protein [Aquabacterium terrae]